MSEIHEGGCLCGSVRYRTTGDPVAATVCHCKFCQRRTRHIWTRSAQPWIAIPADVERFEKGSAA